MECILCADSAQIRKYFLKDNPLCTMHYAEYLEALIVYKKYRITDDDAENAFSGYKMTLSPKPLSESALEHIKKISESNAKARLKNKKLQSEQSANNNPFGMGM